MSKLIKSNHDYVPDLSSALQIEDPAATSGLPV